MLQKYIFFDGGILEFDDSKTVKELIKRAFDEFDYYEPAGQELVTLFQSHHPETNTGWFTTDTDKLCRDEIVNRDCLCFAYHLPNVFYFAEGGWGHHMEDLGNHPDIDNPVMIKLRFEDFRNTIVINGNYCFSDIIKYLKKTEYIPDKNATIRVLPIGDPHYYEISESDNMMKIKLSEFEEAIEKRTDELIPEHKKIYHFEFEIL